MIVPFILLLISSAGLSAALIKPGLADLILLAAPCAVASLILLLGANRRRGRQDSGNVRPRRPPFWRRDKKYVIVDGSNVMHWNNGTPQLQTLRDVVRHLKKQGFTPGVVFDANAGHILTGKYQHHSAMAQLLDLPEDRVMVVDKGTPADPTILAAAKELNARIVTNDRYRDWAGDHPEIAIPGHLIRGSYAAGKLWLDLETATV